MDQPLEKIEELAGLFLTIEEIAFLCDIDEANLRREIRGKKSPAAKAYYRGKLNTVVAMRRQTLDFAKAGSPQAESLMIEFIDKQDSNE